VCAEILISATALFFTLARWGFQHAWGEFRLLRQERLARASGLLSPAFESARLDPFRHLPKELAMLTPQALRFEPLGVVTDQSTGAIPDPLLRAIQDWEDHHHSVSTGFLEAISHVAHHRLASHPELRSQIEPIGDALERLIAECPEPSLQKELRMAHAGLKTGAAQNLEYISRRLFESAHATRTAFHAEIGQTQSELKRVRHVMIEAICLEVREEIEHFMEAHRGFCLNPIAWGRQTAYYREFEQLRDEMERARASGDLSEISLITIMVAEDEKLFVGHIHAAIRSRDALHERLSLALRKSNDQLVSETQALTGWASQENQRLQSSVSHQLIQFIERWQQSAAKQSDGEHDQDQVTAWILQLSKIRDQDPELAALTAA
jgi:hypothetical protein